MSASSIYRPLCIASLLLTVCAPAATAQSQRPYNELGLQAGGMNYIGDLNNQSLFGTVSPAGGFFFRRNIDSRWAVTIGGAIGTVKGGNPDAKEWRNLSFRSTIWEGSLRAEFNFVSFGYGDVQYPFTPYIFAGLGVFGFNPKARYTDPATGQTSWVELEPLGTEGQYSDLYPDVYPYSTTAVCLPFGVGFKARLSRSVVVAVEYGFRKTWTDYIDDVSTVYVAPETFADNPRAAALYDRSAEIDGGQPNTVGTIRGDDSLNDWYAFFNVSLAVSTDLLFGWMRSKRCYND